MTQYNASCDGTSNSRPRTNEAETAKKTACTCVHFVHSDYFLLVPAVGLACMAKVKKQNLKKKVKARRSIRLSVVKRLLATLIG